MIIDDWIETLVHDVSGQYFPIAHCTKLDDCNSSKIEIPRII